MRNIADVTIAVANGDLSKKINVDVRGEILPAHPHGARGRHEAGASDYIAKPVNTEELLALVRMWSFGKQRVAQYNYEQ